MSANPDLRINWPTQITQENIAGVRSFMEQGRSIPISVALFIKQEARDLLPVGCKEFLKRAEKDRELIESAPSEIVIPIMTLDEYTKPASGYLGTEDRNINREPNEKTESCLSDQLGKKIALAIGVVAFGEEEKELQEELDGIPDGEFEKQRENFSWKKFDEDVETLEFFDPTRAAKVKQFVDILAQAQVRQQLRRDSLDKLYVAGNHLGIVEYITNSAIRELYNEKAELLEGSVVFDNDEYNLRIEALGRGRQRFEDLYHSVV